MLRKIFIGSYFLTLCSLSLLHAADFDITKFGAVGDGKTLNTVFIQKAIDECNRNGGGRVTFPAGVYLSATIELKDNVTLHLEKNARLLGTTDIEQYRNLDPFTEGLGIDVGWALLVAVDAKNIGIEGEGAIDGQGSKLKAEHILKDTRPEGQRWGRRPFLIRIVRCTGVTVKDITLNYAAAWTSHYFQSKQIKIENVKIVSVGVAHNDGIGIDGCQDVTIKNCDVVSGDDALVFKTTSSKMACKNIVVSGMRLKSSQAGIKMGTESMAPFEDIKISNCHIYETRNGGIKLLTVDGAHLRNIEISDITMTEVRTPMLFRLGSRLSVFRKSQDSKQPTGTFENVVIKNVKAKAADSAQLTPPTGILITGVPGHYITNLTLENIEIDLLGTGTVEQSKWKVPEAIDQYPEVKTFGPTIPAYGIWARHVKGLKLKNITFHLKNNDLRPAFICEDGKDIEATGWNIPATPGNEKFYRLENVEGAVIRNNNVGEKTSSVTPLWKDFEEAKKAGKAPVLPDFSYAGYHFSEKEIPSVTGRKYFNVKDYGALPNDEIFDDAAIQKTIDAAEKNPGGGVVFFPPGKYIIAADNDSTKQIKISKSNIVLKGSGSGNAGTEIYQANMRINGRQFIFKPTEQENKKLTIITKDARRESFSIEVEDASKLKVGQDIVIRHRSEEFTRSYFAPLQLKPEWTRLLGDKGGMQINEIHTIEKIEKNKITFKNPVHLDIRMVKSATWDIYTFNYIEECGVEDILFTSNWKTYPEEFIHHKNAIHDYAYEAVGMEYIKNSWVRNCVFQDWNEGVFIRAGYQVSVLNTDFKGKKGHASVHARAGYGVLIKNCHFNNAQHHGAGTGYSAVGTVITQCSLGTDQNFDIHSGQPYATLYDNIEGGVFYNLGGPEPGHPHHGRDLVLWNFHHLSAKDQHYNFWDMTRRRNYTIAQPKLAGFQSNTKVDFENVGINESQGKEVSPKSLFEAQLELRINSVTQSLAKSQWVYTDAKGKLNYKTLESGDRIMDFSYAGYKGGGVKIPSVDVKIVLDPIAGDNSVAIQQAIDEVSKMKLVNGFRGAILLKPGTYDCEKALTIKASGVVLRGSGSGANGTIINLTGKPHVCVEVRGAVSSKTIGDSTKIADKYVPAGTNSFNVIKAPVFSVGDTIRIIRPVTNEWIEFMGMDHLVRAGQKQTWISGDITTERIIRKIEKNKITVDVPLNDSYDSKYTGSQGVSVKKISTIGELSQIGIENFRITATAQSVTISEGHHRAFTMSGIRDGWARNIEVFNTVNSISVTGKRITVDNISIIHDVPTLGAAKPADLNGSGQQILFNRCNIQGDNLFFFGTGAKVTGPVVVLNCVFKGNGWIQPHQRWATGLLIDGCEVPDGGIDFMNRGIMGSGHGWTIGWAVAWNCKAKSYLNQMPPGSANWVIGSKGEKQRRAIPGSNQSGNIVYDTVSLLPEGIYDSYNVPVAPSSLYLAQLKERLGKQALINIGY